MAEFDWRSPEYGAIFEERIARLDKLRSDPSIVDPIKQFYAENPAKFITDWGCTFDPRNVEIGLPAIVPFMLFQKQEQFITWLYERWRAREDGLAEKSRDMGVSWLCVAFGVWMWIFHPGTVIGYGSRKEEYVDKIGDPKSLFWKARKFVELLPYEFKPVGYDERKHAPHMRLINPENGATMVGEAGDNIGRGNRTAIYFKDESAFYEHADSIDAALSQTSNCKIDVSTPNGAGNAFYRKRHSKKIPVFTFHWRDDPRKGEEWYAKQLNDLDPVIVAQEIDINYSASASDVWLDGDKIRAAQSLPKADVQATGMWIVSIDAAHMGNDESVITGRSGRLTLPQEIINGYDGIQLAERTIAFCDRLNGQIGGIVIELDGPGVSCYDQLKRSKYAKFVKGIHTGARQSNGRDYNLRSKIWRRAKEYMTEGPFHLPPDTVLSSQLSAMRYSYKDGELLMQPKKEYKVINGCSPDRGDSWILGFAMDGQEVDAWVRSMTGSSVKAKVGNSKLKRYARA